MGAARPEEINEEKKQSRQHERNVATTPEVLPHETHEVSMPTSVSLGEAAHVRGRAPGSLGPSFGALRLDANRAKTRMCTAGRDDVLEHEAVAHHRIELHTRNSYLSFNIDHLRH